MTFKDIENPVDQALMRGAAQSALFAETPKRLAVSKAEIPTPDKSIRIFVHRNHAFEHVTDLTAPWLAWWGVDAQFDYGHYVDTFDFGTGDTADLHIISVDCARYAEKMSADALVEWLPTRVKALRALTDAPVLMLPIVDDDTTCAALAAALDGMVAVRVAPMDVVRDKMGAKFLDPRLAGEMGTPLSGKSCLETARCLACHWIPTLVTAPLKAIVLDLDNTLYSGVLGEDGHAVELTPAHEALQKDLAALAEDGVMLAVASKNEPEDAKALFESRADFPLKWSHFAAAGVSWSAKSEEIQRVLETLRIAPDSVIFVDDNPGELAEVTRQLPVKTVFAGNPEDARRTLAWFPGLHAWSRSATDQVRTKDMLANQQREALICQARSDEDYFASLGVTLTVEVDPHERLERLHEMSRKTNQFNLNLQRISEVEMARMLEDPNRKVACVGLSDRLSDSGIVAMVVADIGPDEIVVNEVTISCRAMGRKLEPLMIAAALEAMATGGVPETLTFVHRTGPRNGPARTWLTQTLGTELAKEGVVQMPKARVMDVLDTNLPIKIHKANQNGFT